MPLVLVLMNLMVSGLQPMVVSEWKLLVTMSNGMTLTESVAAPVHPNAVVTVTM